MDVSAEVGLDFTAHPDGRNSSVGLDVYLSADAGLPGLKLSVEKVRFTTGLSLVLDGGQLAVAAAPLQVAGPAGAGAEVELPAFTGGGYLHYQDGKWRGALSAHLGPVAVSGFGILRTDRFSLLLLLAAEFDPPVQLSFGFTLVGVGGLVGINRRPDMGALQRAARSGELSRMLFPRDAAAEAARLLPVLDASFPQQDGSIIVGPMLKLGWGTPTLCAATIGVLIGEEGVIVLGRVAVTLPFEQAALIRLEGIVFGMITGDGLFLGTSLENSTIAGIPVDGDIALRIRGGDDPLFALSVGGFHPGFTPPDGMAGLKPIRAGISPGVMLQAELRAYLAVTTNSVDFGASAILRAGLAGFGIEGGFAFDARINLDPFGFVANFTAHVSVEAADFSVGSVSLGGHLSGPSPWRICGHASVSVLWWDVDVDVPELTWGTADVAPLPAGRPPAAVLAAQLADPAAWTEASRALPPLVRLRPGADRDAAAVHPLSELSFRQSAVPVNLELQRMDGRPLATPVTLRVTKADSPDRLSFIRAPFPPAQFRELDDAAKLSASGYADFDAGFDLNPQPAAVPGAVRERDLDTPETTVLGDDFCFSKFRSTLHDKAFRSAPFVEQRNTSPFVKQLRSPGDAVVTSVHDLSRDVLSGVSSSPAVAETLLAGLAAEHAAALQVSRAWEVAT